MTTSEQINEIAGALAKAQGEMEGAAKSAANPFFKSKYADLASVRDACMPALTKHGLSVVQFPRTTYIGTPEIIEVASRSGETRMVVKAITVVSMVTRLLHTSGQWMEDDGFSTMLPTADPQAVGSAATYLRRYTLSSSTSVAPEDDDAEAAQGRGKANGHAAQPIVVTPAPKGFNEWLTDLTAVADEGTDALKAAWTKSKPEYRTYLNTTFPKKLDDLKAHAKALDPEPVSA
jgi:hypothetical protein